MLHAQAIGRYTRKKGQRRGYAGKRHAPVQRRGKTNNRKPRATAPGGHHACTQSEDTGGEIQAAALGGERDRGGGSADRGPAAPLQVQGRGEHAHSALYCLLIDPRIRRANARSLFMSVTRLACRVHR